MLIALPLIGVVLASAGMVRAYPDCGVRAAVVASSLLAGLFAYAVAELFGFFGALTAPAIATAWIGFIAVAAIVLFRQRAPWQRLGWSGDAIVAALTAPIGLLILITAILGLLGPANTYDGLLYHLPRVMHWRQDQSLTFYPSQVLPQLHHPPFSEVMMLHSVLLSGLDGFVNLVSWWFYVVSIVGVSLIAKQLGGSGRIQALAALLSATIPIAVLQASGPKNDLALSFCLVSMTWLLVRSLNRFSWVEIVIAGLALGLALSTKGSAALFAAPIIGTLGLVKLRLRPSQTLSTIGAYLLVGVLAAVIAAPHALRNFELYGSVLGPPYDGPTPAFAYQATAFDPEHIGSAVIKHVGAQAGTPWPAINQQLDSAIRAWHDMVGLKIDDPSITWGNRSFYVVPMVGLQEEAAPNPLSVLLIVVSVSVGFVSWRRQSVPMRCFLVVLPMTFLLYSALIKWQPATTRFQLPILVLWCPVIALLISQVSGRMIIPVAAAAIVGVTPAIFDNRWRPLTGELNVFTGDRQALALGLQSSRKDLFNSAAEIINGRACQSVGMELDWDTVEYPWRRLLPDARIEHFNVSNVSRGLRYPAPAPLQPCAALSLGTGPAERVVIEGVTLEAVMSEGGVTVYLPPGQMPAATLQYSADYQLSIPDVWQRDSTQRYSVTLTNRGWETWLTATGYFLSASFGHESDEPHDRWETERRIKLPRDVAPGEMVTFDIELQAPSEPGPYTVRHRLFRDGSPWFGQIDRRQVNIPEPTTNRRR